MHYYVELLRVKRALYIAGVILAIVFVVAVILRASLHGSGALSWAGRVESSRTAVVKSSQLPGGWSRVVVDDNVRQIHAIIDRRGNTIKIDATVPANESSSLAGNLSMGSGSSNVSVNGDRAHVTMWHQEQTPDFNLGYLFLFSLPMGFIIATVLAGVLAKENDGHLELAWTKPVSRERYAIAALAVDTAGILVSQLLTIGVILAATIMFLVPRFSYTGPVGLVILFAVFGPLAWYAALTAASASLKRGPGLVMGLGWLAGIVVPSVAAGLAEAAPVSPVAGWFYAIFHAASYLDPIAYMSMHGSNVDVKMSAAPAGLLGLSIGGEVAVLAALFVAYAGLSVLQWRRVEA
jgi:ABC-type transport system involved in multi-copper enzyme maturation permease subunit